MVKTRPCLSPFWDLLSFFKETGDERAIYKTLLLYWHLFNSAAVTPGLLAMKRLLTKSLLWEKVCTHIMNYCLSVSHRLFNIIITSLDVLVCCHQATLKALPTRAVFLCVCWPCIGAHHVLCDALDDRVERAIAVTNARHTTRALYIYIFINVAWTDWMTGWTS